MIILRDVMRMEFPDRFTDITTSPCYYKAAADSGDNSPPYSNVWLIVRSPGSNSSQCLQHVPTQARSAIAGRSYSWHDTDHNNSCGLPTAGFPSERSRGAELLYMIIANSNYNGANGLSSSVPARLPTPMAMAFQSSWMHGKGLFCGCAGQLATASLTAAR